METLGTWPPSAADPQSSFRMINVGAKADTQRRAVASGYFRAAGPTLRMIERRELPKGDVLTLAEVAGIQGAKRAADTLPLCHPLPLTSVRVWSEVREKEILVFCEAQTVGKTGVEMEALAGVTAALLCLYDLAKGVDPVLEIGGIHLDFKEGGKSGIWINPNSSPPASTALKPAPPLEGLRAALITISDRCFSGENEDRSGHEMQAWLEEKGAKVPCRILVSDEPDMIQTALFELLQQSEVEVIITSGGTGLSPRDVTPETVEGVAVRLGGKGIPGIGELLRASGSRTTSMAWLSRSAGYLIRGKLVILLPGSPRAVIEGLGALQDILSHAVHIVSGGDHARGGHR